MERRTVRERSRRKVEMFGDWDWTLILGVGLLLVLLYKLTLGRKLDHWEERGVPFIPPWPFFGNTFVNTLGLKTQMEFHASVYRQFKGHRFGGLYLMRRPVLYLMEPELVESVLVKDFSHFANRGLRPNPHDPFTLHLVNLRDEQWRRLRQTLTPVFSSGKLRVMTETMEKCVDCLIEGWSGALAEGERGGEVELRESMARLTTDVIGATALGLDTRALADPDSEFRRIGKRLFRPTFLSKIRTTLRVAYPGVLSALRWKSLPKDAEEFFRNVIGQAIEERKERPRQDVLQLMIDLLHRPPPPSPDDTDRRQ